MHHSAPGFGGHCEILQTRGKKNEFMTRITMRRQFSSNQSRVTQNASLVNYFFVKKVIVHFLNLPKSPPLNREKKFVREI